MAATNSKALSVNPGIVEVALWNSSLSTPASDLSNASTLKSEYDALSYERLASVIDVQLSENFGDNVLQVETDDNGIIYSSTVPTVSISWSWYEVLEPDTINIITGQNSVSVAGALVPWATQTIASWSKAFNQFIKIENQNWDGSAIVVNSVTGATDGPLVADTDYYVWQNADGDYGIYIIDSVTVTTMAQVFTINYDYTPNASVYGGYTINARELPKLVVRITSTDSATGKDIVYYLVDSNFTWELVTWFVDVVRNGDISNSPFTFGGLKWGSVLKYNEITA